MAIYRTLRKRKAKMAMVGWNMMQRALLKAIARSFSYNSAIKKAANASGTLALMFSVRVLNSSLVCI